MKYNLANDNTDTCKHPTDTGRQACDSLIQAASFVTFKAKKLPFIVISQNKKQSLFNCGLKAIASHFTAFYGGLCKNTTLQITINTNLI